MFNIELLEKLELKNGNVFGKKIDIKKKSKIYYEEKENETFLKFLLLSDKDKIAFVKKENVDLFIDNIYVFKEKDIIAKIDKEEYLKWEKE